MAIATQNERGYVGKVGNRTYYKGAAGQTVVREIVAPKNPKTLAQRIQRVITKTVGANYKAMKAICDHSFEGKTMGFECANRFRQLNANRMRERASYLQEQGISLYEYFNFLRIGDVDFMPAAVYVSEGSLNQVYASIANNLAVVNIGGNTYGQVISALGAQRGDQMTFVTVEKNTNGKYIFRYARVILDPRNENGAAPLTTAFVTDNAIVAPNSRNKGNFGALAVVGTNLQFKLDATSTVVAAGIIMSRKSGSAWFRSSCQLALSEDALGNDKMSLMEAASVSDAPVAIDVDSEQFLNNAGVGGGEGSSAPASGGDDGQGGSTTPAIGNTAQINGASQSIAGGSISVTSLSSVSFSGTLLTQLGIKMKKNGGADVSPTTELNTQVAFTGITGAAVNDRYTFTKTVDGTTSTFLTIIIVQAGGDDDGDQI